VKRTAITLEDWATLAGMHATTKRSTTKGYDSTIGPQSLSGPAAAEGELWAMQPLSRSSSETAALPAAPAVKGPPGRLRLFSTI